MDSWHSDCWSLWENRFEGTGRALPLGLPFAFCFDTGLPLPFDLPEEGLAAAACAPRVAVGAKSGTPHATTRSRDLATEDTGGAG